LPGLKLEVLRIFSFPDSLGVYPETALLLQ
jgi:hypothetical protein